MEDGHIQDILNTIGNKFDISFDEREHDPKEEQPREIIPTQHQHSTINPENVLETNQSSAQEEEEGKEAQVERVPIDVLSCPAPSKKQEEEIIQTSFLSLLEKDDKEVQQDEAIGEKPQMIEGETVGQFESEEEEMEYYRTLSEKFENALGQAKSRKSFSDFQGEFIERQEHYKKKKQNSLNMLLMEKQRREKGQVRAKPLINSYSQQILNHYTPIDKRYPAVLNEKKRKVEQWQEEQRKREEQAQEEETREMEKWAQIVRQRVGTPRTTDQYYQDMRLWVEKRDKNIQQNADKKEESFKADISFKPKINPRSDKLMRKKPDRIPVYEKEPQVKRLPVDEHCTFKPNLTKVLRRKQ